MDFRQVVHQRRERSRERGFTFLEIMIAVMLLASASAILVGMQGAAIQRGARDLQAQQAMLMARRIMASIEALTGREFDLTSQGPLPARDLLNQFKIPPSEDPVDERITQQLQASLEVEDWLLPIPNAEASPMKKISLGISWGSHQPSESFRVLLLMPPPTEGQR